MRIEAVDDETTDDEHVRDEHVSDELPAELDASNFVGPYLFPDNNAGASPP